MSIQDLVSGQVRLIKVSSSRISELLPGCQVFVLSAVSAQRKILGQFHVVKSVQADMVTNTSTSCFVGIRNCSNLHLHPASGGTFPPGIAPIPGRSLGDRRRVMIAFFVLHHFCKCAHKCNLFSTGCTKYALFQLDKSHLPTSMALATCCADASTGECVSIYSKVLHHQDPTQLLMKELTGNVVRSGDGCILLGEYSVYEENVKLEQSTPAMRDGTEDRLPHFFCDLLVATSGLNPPLSPSMHFICA